MGDQVDDLLAVMGITEAATTYKDIRERFDKHFAARKNTVVEGRVLTNVDNTQGRRWTASFNSYTRLQLTVSTVH